MQPYQRPSPAAASPSSPRTNPQRTNNPREGYEQSNMDPTSPTSPNEPFAPTGPSQDSIQKLTQIVQNYFNKAAQIIIQSRVDVAPVYSRETREKRVNKWFNVELDETDAFRADLRPWRQGEPSRARAMPLIIETYLDVADLTSAHSLGFVDDHGKLWMVNDALDPHATDGRLPARTQIILERWIIELGDQGSALPADLGTILPVVYKKSIIMFRSLFTYAKVLPAGKLSLRLKKATFPTSNLLVRCRVLNGNDIDRPPAEDTLELPLDLRTGKVTETYSFGSIDSPAGPFSVKVIYRASCDFRIEDNEAVLSSQFVNMDERLFRPSLGERRLSTSPRTEVGSLPAHHKRLSALADPSQAYGSLSSFHHVGPQLGTSPISALRAAGDLVQGSASNSPPTNTGGLRSAHDSRASIRSTDSPGTLTPRRPSVSFMPFKGPALSQSPATTDLFPRDSPSRAFPSSLPARNRHSLGPLSPTTRTQSVAIEQSPQERPPLRPGSVPRFSSSFGQHRKRYSIGAASKTEDETTSSGRGSVASSVVVPASGVLPEAQPSSVTTDEENISDFLKFLDAKKNLTSFNTTATPAAIEGSTRRTAMALSKFQKMKNANDSLSVSISSSMLMNRSSTPSSRQLSEVPPLVGGVSISTSSSPGKPISPHTPHTPAVPSRLSANSVAEYTVHPRRSRGPSRASDSEREAREGIRQAYGAVPIVGTAPVNIPISPRPIHPHVRRSSSVSQQNRVPAGEDDASDIFGNRSASLGDERSAGQDGALPSLSRLLRRNEASADITADDAQPVSSQAGETTTQEHDSADAGDVPAPSPRTTSSRPRGALARRRGSSSGQGFYSSLVSDRDRDAGTPAERSGSGSGGSRRGSAAGSVGSGLWWQHGYSASARAAAGAGNSGTAGTGNADDDGEEDEPFPFAMSEIGTLQGQNRRSVDRGAASSGSKTDPAGRNK